MPLIRAALKDPLTHFLAAGAVIFAVASALAPPQAGDKRILVDRAALLEFIQYRSKAFEPAAAAALLDGMDGAARDRLIADFIEEEALYREAKALGLDADDYVVKRRLIQRLAFLAEASAGDRAPTEGEIAAWYDAHQGDYAAPASATFAHVFFDAERRGADAARAAAEAAVARLHATGARFEDAVGEGDRFPFHTNYVERTRDLVAAEFGPAAAADIFGGATGVWRGPVVSTYGAHAVYVRAVAPARTPALAEISARVAEDVARDRKGAADRAQIAETIADYEIVMAPDARRSGSEN